MFGMEIETRIPLEIKVAGDDRWPTIMRDGKALEFKVDVDRSGGHAVAEFVMTAFKNHDGTLDEARAQFNRRFDRICAVIDQFAAAVPGTPLLNLAEDCELFVVEEQFKAVENGGIAQFFPPADAEPGSAQASKLDGPIHYTLGISMRALPGLIQDKLAKIGQHGESRRRAAEGGDLGALLTTRNVPGPLSPMPPPGGDFSAATMHGYIALLYMQIAAVRDGHLAVGGGLTKHRTQALCRVPLDTIFNSFSPAERLWLTTNWDKIETQITTKWQATAAPTPGDWTSSKQEALDKQVLKLVTGAFAFGAKPVDLEQIFGAMTVVQDAELVGPKPYELGYALELRHLPIGAADHMKLREFSLDLLAYDRLLHDTDKAALPPPRARTRSVDSADKKR